MQKIAPLREHPAVDKKTRIKKLEFKQISYRNAVIAAKKDGGFNFSMNIQYATETDKI